METREAARKLSKMWLPKGSKKICKTEKFYSLMFYNLFTCMYIVAIISVEQEKPIKKDTILPKFKKLDFDQQ